MVDTTPKLARFRDLAPKVFRQRMIIEGVPNRLISDKDIKTYLSKLSNELAMITIRNPETSKSKRYGWAGWIHWESSGAHFYAWNEVEYSSIPGKSTGPFFSVDIYTCKAFDPQHALEFTIGYFGSKPDEVTFKEV